MAMGIDAVGALMGLAPQLVPGCDLAALTRWDAGVAPITVYTTDEVSADVDRLEHRLGEGPTLSGSGSTSFHKIADVAFDKRWPLFGEAVAMRTPVRAALAYHLVTRRKRATLTLYGLVQHCFGPSAIAPAAMFAVHIRSLLDATTSDEGDHAPAATVGGARPRLSSWKARLDT